MTQADLRTKNRPDTPKERTEMLLKDKNAVIYGGGGAIGGGIARVFAREGAGTVANLSSGLLVD